MLVLVALFAGLVLAGGVVAADSGTATDATTQAELACEFPFEVEDGGGETVTVEEEPEDVVVLAPNNAQHMWEIGAQDKVTGMPVNPFTAYLEGSEDRTNVVDDEGLPNEEEIVALEPDLVIGADVIPDESIQQLRDAGLTVYQSPLLASIDDMFDEVERVGQLVGECDGATEAVGETRERMDEIAEAVADEDVPTVYYDQGFPWTAGEGTLENELITMAGGDNIALEAEELSYFQISEEVVAENDPEWLVLAEGAPVPDATAIQESTAVEEDQIVRVNPNYISQHGPRNVIPLEEMAEAFHPAVMEELDATPTPDDEETPTPDADDTETPTPEEPDDDDTPVPEQEDDTDDAADDAGDDMADDADDDGAGFAVGAAVAALIAFALVGRYRR